MAALPESLDERIDVLGHRIAMHAATVELDAMMEHDLTKSQLRVMIALACANEPRAVSEVADAIRLSDAATSRAVDALVRAGLLDRRESEDDRRVKHVALTPAGTSLLEAGRSYHRAIIRSFVDRLSPAVAEELHRVTGAVLEELQFDPEEGEHRT